MRDLHEQAKSKQESLCSQVDEVVSLKQMEIVKLQKELEVLQKVRQIFSAELQPATPNGKSDDAPGGNSKLISSVKPVWQD
jgi:hypothetical protein